MTAKTATLGKPQSGRSRAGAARSGAARAARGDDAAQRKALEQRWGALRQDAEDILADAKRLVADLS